MNHWKKVGAISLFAFLCVGSDVQAEEKCYDHNQRNVTPANPTKCLGKPVGYTFVSKRYTKKGGWLIYEEITECTYGGGYPKHLSKWRKVETDYYKNGKLKPGERVCELEYKATLRSRHPF